MNSRLGLNGLGSCATQYSSEYFDATVRRDGFKYTLHFEKGELVGKMKKEPADRKTTGSVFRWKPDLAVFTDINIPKEYFEDTLKRQAVVNAGVTLPLPQSGRRQIRQRRITAIDQRHSGLCQRS